MTERNEFRLPCGRVVRLLAINQWGTYSGLLEGVPTRELNEGSIRQALEEAKRLWQGEPYLVPPKETPIDLKRDYPFGTPASIPGITCIARFHSFETVENEMMDYSELPIVWFQAKFAFPIDEAVQDHIRALDWARYAKDYQY